MTRARPLRYRTTLVDATLCHSVELSNNSFQLSHLLFVVLLYVSNCVRYNCWQPPFLPQLYSYSIV